MHSLNPIFSMTLGYVHEIIHEGQRVEIKDPSSNYCETNNRTFQAKDGKFEAQISLNNVLNADVKSVSDPLPNGV